LKPWVANVLSCWAWELLRCQAADLCIYASIAMLNCLGLLSCWTAGLLN
jgi:hypothetical protein